MAERPINLNKARKARARAAAKQQADRNAVIHGMTGAEKARARAEADRAERQWRGGLRGPDATVEPPED